ncbi:MAG: hypothetical protein ACPGVO_05465 [Spirulinaceae cyanobacterium]
MVGIIPARTVKLYDLREQFGLTRSLDLAIFEEWQAPLPTLSPVTSNKLGIYP